MIVQLCKDSISVDVREELVTGIQVIPCTTSGQILGRFDDGTRDLLSKALTMAFECSQAVSSNNPYSRNSTSVCYPSHLHHPLCLTVALKTVLFMPIMYWSHDTPKFDCLYDAFEELNKPLKMSEYLSKAPFIVFRSDWEIAGYTWKMLLAVVKCHLGEDSKKIYIIDDTSKSAS